MIIKVCGMRDPDNIRAVNELGVDLIGMTFYQPSPRFVPLVNSHAGIIPDRVEENAKKSLSATNAKFVGVFVDEMPQTVVTNVYNFNLDYVQLQGEESPIYIDNLRATLDPDIHPGLKIIKTINVESADDFKVAKQYEGHADLLLFFMNANSRDGSAKQAGLSMLDSYDGTIPFLVNGGFCSDDVEMVKTINHPQFVGIDLNLEFETEPAIKDVPKLKEFVEKVRI